MSAKQILVKMDKNPPLEVHPANTCCGGHSDDAGYLCGSDEEGNGFVIWIEEREVFEALARVVAKRC